MSRSDVSFLQDTHPSRRDDPLTDASIEDLVLELVSPLARPAASRRASFSETNPPPLSPVFGEYADGGWCWGDFGGGVGGFELCPELEGVEWKLWLCACVSVIGDRGELRGRCENDDDADEDDDVPDDRCAVTGGWDDAEAV